MQASRLSDTRTHSAWVTRYCTAISSLPGAWSVDNLLVVDFAEPWWKVYTPYWFGIMLNMIATTIQISLVTLIPLVVPMILMDRSYVLIASLTVFLLLFSVYYFVARWRLAVFLEGVFHSIYLSAITLLATVDVLHHATAQTGKSTANIHRAATSAKDFIAYFQNIGIWIPLYLIIGSVSFWFIHPALVGIFACTSVIMVLPTAWFRLVATPTFQQQVIASRDNLESVTTEVLYQTLFMRAVFATQELLHIVRRRSQATAQAGIAAEIHSHIATFFQNIVFAVGMCLFVLMSVWLQDQGILAIEILIGANITFFVVMYQLRYVDVYIADLYVQAIEVHTAFEYINTFGTQTYPVLPGDVVDENGEV